MIFKPFVHDIRGRYCFCVDFRFVAIRPAITMPVKYLAICDEQEKHKSAFGLRKHFPSS